MEYFFSNKKETIDTCHNMDESQKVYAKCKKPFTKDHTLCDYIYVKYPQKTII